MFTTSHKPAMERLTYTAESSKAVARGAGPCVMRAPAMNGRCMFVLTLQVWSRSPLFITIF